MEITIKWDETEKTGTRTPECYDLRTLENSKVIGVGLFREWGDDICRDTYKYRFIVTKHPAKYTAWCPETGYIISGECARTAIESLCNFTHRVSCKKPKICSYLKKKIAQIWEHSMAAVQKHLIIAKKHTIKQEIPTEYLFYLIPKQTECKFEVIYGG